MFAAVRSSDFLKDQFAGFKILEVASADESWSGIYISGERTYLEIFPVHENASQVGVAFGTDHKDEILSVHEIMQKSDRSVDPIEMNYIKEADNSLKEWYRSFHLVPGSLSRAFWLMELDPSFLSRVFGSEYDGYSIDRKTFLRRMYKPDRVLKDIRRLQIEVDMIETLHESLALVGLGTDRRGLYSDGYTEIELIEVARPRGLVEIGFQLHEDHNPMELRFGKSRMKFDGGPLANWELYP